MGSFVKGVIMPVALLALSAALLVRALNDRSYLSELIAEPSDVAALGFTATDASGQQLELASGQAERRAIVVLHNKHLSAEVAYWNKVRVDLPDSIKLIGVCETKACSDSFASHANSAFPVVTFGSYEATLAVLSRNAEGYIPVINKQGGILASVKTRARPEDMAADLTKEADLEHL